MRRKLEGDVPGFESSRNRECGVPLMGSRRRVACGKSRIANDLVSGAPLARFVATNSGRYWPQGVTPEESVQEIGLIAAGVEVEETSDCATGGRRCRSRGTSWSDGATSAEEA